MEEVSRIIADRQPGRRASDEVEDRLLPVSAVAELLYCERSFFLEVTRGRKKERNIFVDRGLAEDADRLVRETNIVRGKRLSYGIRLASEELGLSGYLDAVVETDDGLVPVEFKSSEFRESDVHDIALCAYAMMLEEAGYGPVREGRVVYVRSRKARTVAFDDELRARVMRTVDRAYEILDAADPPKPVNDGRCRGCSFASWCLPPSRSDEAGAGVLPRLGLDRVLYVDSSFAFVRLRSGNLEVVEKDALVARVPIETIDRVVVVGRSEVSASAVRALLRQGIDIFFLSRTGRLEGSATPEWSLNGILREAQFKYAAIRCFRWL